MSGTNVTVQHDSDMVSHRM